MKKSLFAVMSFAAMFVVVALFAVGCRHKHADSCVQCQCAVIEAYENNPDAKGMPPVCAVCTIWCDDYAPCAASVAECPAQSRKTLAACPLCSKCKQAFLKAKKGVSHCKVRTMLTPDLIAANRQCKECPEVAKKAAKDARAKHAKNCVSDCLKSGKCKTCQQPCECQACGTPDCDCPACPCAAVVITEEEIVEMTPAAVPAANASNPSVKPLPVPNPNPALKTKADSGKAPYPVPAPPANANPPGNISPAPATPFVAPNRDN